MQATEKIWMNGELVDWDDAKVHVGAHGLHYGTGVFEGIRCYDTPQGPAVFRLRDHIERHGHVRRRCSTCSCRTRSTSCAPRRWTSSARTGFRPATCGRSPSTATASSASRRATTRSTS